MSKPKALKVFRTPIGFHDAYVATPTKKAALEAWGSDRNLFALGQAEEINEPRLMRAPLATPGIVIKVSRGTTAEQLRALPPDAKPKPEKPEPGKPERKRASRLKPPRPKKPAPRPSRAKLEEAEAALDRLSAANAKEIQAIDEEIATLRQRRKALVEQHTDAVKSCQSALDRAKATYDAQLDRWRSDS